MKTLLRLSHLGLSQAVFLLALACGTEDPDGGPQAGASGAPNGTGGAIGGGGGQTVAGSPGIAGSPAGGSNVGGGGAAGSPVAGSSTGSASGGKPSAGAGGTAAGAGGASAGAGGALQGGAGGASGGSSGGSGGAPGNGGSGGGSSSGEFKLTAPWDSGDATCTKADMSGCARIPEANRSAMIYVNGTPGSNQLPTLSWTAGPTGTQSYALVYHDLSNGFAHWAMWNIPASTTSIAMGSLPAGIKQASFGQGGTWAGSGACDHVYELILYALKNAELTPSGSGNDQTRVRDQLEADKTMMVVLARDAVRGATSAPCSMTRGN